MYIFLYLIGQRVHAFCCADVVVQKGHIQFLFAALKYLYFINDAVFAGIVQHISDIFAPEDWAVKTCHLFEAMTAFHHNDEVKMCFPQIYNVIDVPETSVKDDPLGGDPICCQVLDHLLQSH